MTIQRIHPVSVADAVVKEPSHHEFEIEQPYEELCSGLQMTGNQGIRFKSQQQHQMETLPRSSIKGLEPERREEIARAFNAKLNVSRDT
jgi:hypothetical protein